MKKITFHSKAFDDFVLWSSIDKKIFIKIAKLIEAIERTPFDGIGEQEPLKHNLVHCWSRRINKEHRLIYQIIDDEVRIISVKGHYEL
jgi:toxin YoeB